MTPTVRPPGPRRALLWAAAFCVAAIGVFVQVRARLAARGPETCATAGAARGPDTVTVRPSSFRVLVFTRHEGYSHRSIPAAVTGRGARNGFTVLATEDPGLFADDALRRFAAVIFLNTTGDVLSPPQKAAFERYVHAGGGFVGIHSALDTEAGWAWYRRLLGADFAGHPAHPAGQFDCDIRPGRPEPAPAAALGADRRVVQLPGVARKRHGARERGRRELPGRQDGAIPPGDMVPRVRGRPRLVHGDGPHHLQLFRSAVSGARPRGILYATGAR